MKKRKWRVKGHVQKTIKNLRYLLPFHPTSSSNYFVSLILSTRSPTQPYQHLYQQRTLPLSPSYTIYLTFPTIKRGRDIFIILQNTSNALNPRFLVWIQNIIQSMGWRRNIWDEDDEMLDELVRRTSRKVQSEDGVGDKEMWSGADSISFIPVIWS